MALVKALPRRGFGLGAEKVGAGETAGAAAIGEGSSVTVVKACASSLGSSTKRAIKGTGGGGNGAEAHHPAGASTKRWMIRLAPNARPSRTPGRSKRNASKLISRECYRREGKLPAMKKILASCCLLFACAIPLAAHAELPDSTKFSVTLELGDVAQAKRWLDEGLDPNFEGHLIGTGLMIGAWEGNIPLMALFLARGADLHRTNRFGETALMLAAWKNRTEAMQWLLERGAQPNRAEREWTALHYATFAGNTTLVENLLAAGANPNARSTNGSTPIMMAAREGHTELAKRLLEMGANPALQNDYNEDAVAWAMRQQNYDIAKSFTSAENFAELSRQAAEAHKAIRSIPAPDRVDELLRIARLAESRGRRKDAAALYRRAIAALKAEQAPKKVGAGRTAPATAPSEVKGLVIRAKRDQPEQQGLSITRAEERKQESTLVERLLEQARQAERTGNRAEALRLFRAASAQLKSSTQ